jgi:hypothetical protein
VGQAIVFRGLPTQTTKDDRLRHQTRGTVLSGYYEITERIREAIELCLDVEGAPEHALEFVGIQRVTIAR